MSRNRRKKQKKKKVTQHHNVSTSTQPADPERDWKDRLFQTQVVTSDIVEEAMHFDHAVCYHSRPAPWWFLTHNQRKQTLGIARKTLIVCMV